MSWLPNYNKQKHITFTQAKKYAEKHKESGVKVDVRYSPDSVGDWPVANVAYKINENGQLILIETKEVWFENERNMRGGKGAYDSVFDRELFFMLFNNNTNNTKEN